MAAAVGIVAVMAMSSSAAAALMLMGEEDTKTGPGPAGPAPPPKPPVVVDVPQEMRTSTSPWGKNNGGREMMTAHNKGRLDGDLWAADGSVVGRWYQMDNGKTAEIVGVAIKGRKDYDQWVKTFKVKYRGDGTWKDVDGGATFTGNTDRNTQIEVKFATPVNARYIRIYPQTWNKHMSLRAGLITNSTEDGSGHKLLSIPAGKRKASSWWHTNNDPNWHPSKGVLNSGTGWHIKSGGDPKVQWYEMNMDAPTEVTGVALQGRSGSAPQHSWNFQWITEFTAKYKNSSGQWTDVDSGFVFSGTGDKDQVTRALFNTPVNTTAIRIYPKSWYAWPTGRFDLLGPKSGSTTETYEIQGYSAYDE